MIRGSLGRPEGMVIRYPDVMLRQEYSLPEPDLDLATKLFRWRHPSALELAEVALTDPEPPSRLLLGQTEHPAMMTHPFRHLA